MHVLLRRPARAWAALALALALAALALSAAGAHAAGPTFQIKTQFGERALGFGADGVTWEPATSGPLFRQRWTRVDLPNGTALWENGFGVCLAVPVSATASSFDLLTSTGCAGQNDPRKQWRLETGKPGDAALKLINAKTGQQVITFGSIAGAWPGSQPVDSAFNEFRFNRLP